MLDEKVKIVFKKGKRQHHYAITPYTFSPKLGRKFVSNTFIDIGQGVLQIMEEIFKSKSQIDS